jgi:hypothetical protein
MTKNQMINGGIGIGIGIVSLVFIAFYFKGGKSKPPRPHDYDVSTKRYIEKPPLKKFNFNSDEVLENFKKSRINEITNADPRLATTMKNRGSGKKHTKNRRIR